MFALVLTSLAASAASGRAGCECINITATGCFDVNTRRGSFCYPPAYGSSICAAHDQGLSPFCDGTTNPAFCGQPWCWVDGATCQRSDMTYTVSSFRPELHYSYRTCGGDPTLWKNTAISTVMSGRILRAALPMSHVPMHYYTGANGVPFVGVDDNFSAPVPNYDAGYAVTFWEDLARAGGFQLSWQLVSGGNRALHQSSWTACVADAADGIIDVCPSITWMTPDRLGMATFTQPVRLANFQLMVPKPAANDDFNTKFSFMFQPFTADAWACIVLLVVVIAVLTVYLQPPEIPVDEAPSLHKRLRHPLLLDALQDQVHATFMEFVGAGTDVDPDHVTAVKFVKSGWAVFVLLVLTAYTASFTAFLVTNTYNVPIDGMDTCRSRRCTVCMTAYLAKEMRAVYSNEINYRIEPATNTALTFFTWGYEQIRSGQCDAALIDLTGYEEDPTKQACDMMFVGTTVLQIYTGFAVNPDYADPISYWMRQLSWSAESEYLEARHRRPILPTMECNPHPDLNAPRSATLRLSMYDLVAPALIMVAFVVIGLMVHFLPRFLPRFFAKKDIEAVQVAKSSEEAFGRVTGLTNETMQVDPSHEVEVYTSVDLHL